MRTVFIVAHQGFAYRFLLRSGILEHLLASPDFRLVLLVRKIDVPHMEAEFGSSRVFVRSLADAAILKRHESTKFGPPLARIRQCVLDIHAHHGTGLYWEQHFIESYSALSWRHLITRRLYCGAIYILRRQPWLRRMQRWIEGVLLTVTPHADLYDEFEPDLVVVPSLGFFEIDNYMIREARRMRVKSVGVVINWDHITNKGTAGALPDFSVAWSAKMRDEIVVHHDINLHRIQIAGPAHYDRYFRRDDILERSKFCARYGLDPSRQIIIYAAMSPRPYPYNPDITKLLARGCSEDAFGKPAQVLVRLHPSYLTLQHERPDQWAAEMKRFEEIKSTYGNVSFDSPRADSSDQRGFDLNREDASVLANCLYHADAVVCFFSTLNLEAAIFDRPIVNCYIYEFRAEDRGKGDTIFGVTHLQTIFSSRCSRIVKTGEEMTREIAAYLSRPERDRENRRLLVETEVGNPDGNAAQRIAVFMMEKAGVYTQHSMAVAPADANMKIGTNA